MIPDFVETGILPPGIHSATWGEFATRFVVFQHSDQRLRIGKQLEALIEEAKKSGIVRHLFVVGSYVTNKPEPNDFDCILVLDPAIVSTLMPPFQYNLVSRRMARKIFKGDISPALDGSDAMEEYLQFFQTTRDGQRMGIVEIRL